MRIRGLADEGSKRAKTVMCITDDTSKMLSAILIGNNVVNLSAASLTTTLAYNLGGSMVAVASAVLSVLIILFGEITPKTCLLYTSPSPRDRSVSRMPSSA